MTRIRATCPDCGEVDLRPTDITLDIVRTDVDEVAEGSTYRFECPDCANAVTKPADERIARLLETGGVAVSHHDRASSRARHPAGTALPPHPEDRPDGPVFTYDDILDLHLLLEQRDWFTRLLQAV